MLLTGSLSGVHTSPCSAPSSNKASYPLLFTAVVFFCFVLTLQKEPLSCSAACCPPTLHCCVCVCACTYFCASLLVDTAVVSARSGVHSLTKWDFECLCQVHLRLGNCTILFSQKQWLLEWSAYVAYASLSFQYPRMWTGVLIVMVPSVHSRSRSEEWRQIGVSKARQAHWVTSKAWQKDRFQKKKKQNKPYVLLDMA